MAQTKARTASLMASPEDAETEFYDAMREADVERMMALWADDEEIVCVHPGGTRLVGSRALRAAFESIFSHGGVTVQPEHVTRLSALGTAVHSLLERVEVATPEGARSGWIVATNVYVKTAQGWRMAAHHASPGVLEEPPEMPDAPSVLH
ncbi:MAG TPA: nuclear transport factor 2 family protein [Burkholderiaceae bacterium]|nr:nuclear transport factor 2 family protein [Burkholderiaceae bacterium]